MAGYDLRIITKKSLHKETVDFFEFLKNVGRKYPVRFKYRTIREGKFHITVDGSSGSIDAIFQELILNKGLYYYKCSLEKGKRQIIIKEVISRIFQDLIEERFLYPRSHFLMRHILGKSLDEKFIPGDFKDKFSHEYEITFRKWDLKLLNNWEFIRETDSLLTRFMLHKLGHIPGMPSSKFQILVEKSYLLGLGMDKEVKKVFNKMHEARTNGLHRLKNILTDEEITSLAFQLYNYFQFFEDFSESQKEKTTKLHGKRYKRIKYGDELWTNENGESLKDEYGNPYDFAKLADAPCHDCMAIKGQYHCEGCDTEQCPRCKGQYLGCPCKLNKDF